MKQLAKWGAMHITATRYLITLGSIFLFFYVAFAGFWLQRSMEIEFNNILLFLSIGLIIVSFIRYPFRSRIKALVKEPFGFFWKWKIFDVLLIIAFSLLGLNFGNELEREKISEQPGVEMLIDGISFIPALKVVDIQNNRIKRKGIIKRFIDSMQKKLVNFFVKRFDKIDTEEGLALAGFITLYVALYLILFYILAILSCSIACNGSGAIALVVFILGEVLLFLALYGMIYTTRNWLQRNKEEGPDKRQNNRFSWIASLVVVAVKYLAILIGTNT